MALAGVKALLPIVRVGRVLMESNENEDTRALDSMVEQINLDVQHAEALYQKHRTALRKHNPGWIINTIKRTRVALEKFAKYVRKQDQSKIKASLEAAAKEMQFQMSGMEWETTLKTCHSSLLTVINVMYQVGLHSLSGQEGQGDEVAHASRMPPSVVGFQEPMYFGKKLAEGE
ncbi:hypothetical protein F66182_9882 [Fusarium sp. NRRL 66182]|nr:hypothetical protein F66182_9882 [Fusarium sp. NRRL 66182]